MTNTIKEVMCRLPDEQVIEIFRQAIYNAIGHSTHNVYDLFQAYDYDMGINKFMPDAYLMRYLYKYGCQYIINMAKMIDGVIPQIKSHAEIYINDVIAA